MLNKMKTSFNNGIIKLNDLTKKKKTKIILMFNV